MTKSLNVMGALALLVGALTMSACNTIQGAGRDVEAAGNAVANQAEETEDEMTDGNPRTP